MSTGRLTLTVVAGVCLAVCLYGIWQWFFCRIEVEPGKIAILIAKTGDNLESGQIVALEPGQKGIQLDVLREGRHFRNPLFWDWKMKNMTSIPEGHVGVRTRLYGRDPDLETLRRGRITAEEGEKGILKVPLTEGKYPINTLAELVEIRPAVLVPAGFVGVVTNLEGERPKAQNEFLVEDGEKGVQRTVLAPGRYNINPYVQQVDLVDTRSQRYELFGVEALRFPSSDGFPVTVLMVLEWSVAPERAPEVLVRIGELSGNVEENEVLQKVLIPMLRGFGRIEGSKYRAKDYISGDTRLTFQNAVLEKLRPKAQGSGILIKSLLVNEIEPPQDIAEPIRDREIAKEELTRNQQQILEAKAKQRLERENALIDQARAKVEAETEKLQMVIEAKNSQEVALIEQEKLLNVATTDLEAARREANAILSRGQAEANAVRFQVLAEALALHKAVEAFPTGASFAKYEFYKKVGPRMLSVFASTEGAFGEIFEEYQKSGAE
jgi:uncharacterized membrane protein YqiK